VELSDGNAQPVRRADLHDGVDREPEELAFAQAGAGQELDAQPVEGVGQRAGGLEELGGRGVVEEAGQGLVGDGQAQTL
jgi:hypothetical protein